jgi:beta-lactam-binding protein with PASTA domain
MLRRFLIYLLVGVGTIAVVALVINLAMSVFVGGRQVTVPDVRGLDEETAAAVLDRVDLRPHVVDEHFSMEYPESTISDQNPAPGRIVKQGRRVLLTLSKGGEFYDIPYCLGKPLRTAGIIAERAGFTVGNVARIHSPGGYPDEVVASEPVPGTRAVRGSPVNLLVNEGPRDSKVILPDLKDHAYLSVRMSLERLGVFVKETSMDREFNALRSRVILQRPPAGYVVARRDTVALVITSRPAGEGGL